MPRFNPRFFTIACCLTLGLLLGIGLTMPSMAQEANSHVRIVRLSSVEGTVQVLPGNDTEFMQAYQNMPLIEGSRIETGNDGKAEIEFEDGSVARLTPNSTLTLDQLSMDGNGGFSTQIEIDGGMSYLELRHSDKYSYQVLFGDSEFTPEQNSTVRVNMDMQPAELAVMDGMVMVDKANAYSVEVHTGETVHTDANDPTRYFLAENITPDSWDQWNDDMDQAATALAAQRTSARDEYAGDTGYGWSDLDAYGNWYPVPGYGLMWQPAGYGSGFDPYGLGYWAYYPGYGYMWVSGYPWGWTPFYCGNWNYVGGFGWGWMPGMGCRGYGYGYGYGWGGGGGGYYRNTYFNVKHPPFGYRLPARPIRGPGDVSQNGGVRRFHVITVNRGGALPLRPQPTGTGFTTNPRPIVISGRTVEPLKRVGPVSALRKGSTLARDFPVNTTTRQPVLGTIQRPAAGVPRTGVMRPTTPNTPRPQPSRPQTQPIRPQAQPMPRPQQTRPEQTRPQPTRPEARPNAPAQTPRANPTPRPEPRPMPQPRPEPRPQNAPRPNYTPRPAPMPQQHFNAPPMHFSAPQQHFSPPPMHMSTPSGGGGHPSGGAHR
ncbi:MAG: DUF6600 domain-containing protein [Acidobacteriaceae bacterium]